MTKQTRRRWRDRLEPFYWGIDHIVAALSATPRSWRMLSLRGLRRSASPIGRFLRFVLVSSLARKCGRLVDIREDVYLHGLANLHLGSHISIHPMTYIDATGGITVGSDVSIAHGVTIMSTSHSFDGHEPIREQGLQTRSTSIGDDVWIGAGARILGGSSIGDGSVVAAGAVVTKSHPPRSILAGVPARVIGSR